MSIETDLIAHIKPLTLAELGDRIYPIVAPQNVVYPYATYMIVSNNDMQDFGGQVYENRLRVQIDIFSKTYSNSKSVLGVVKDSLYSFKHYPHFLKSMEMRENDTGLFRQLIDFNLTI